jgi:arylsulfatase A-like enzyme
VSKLPLPLAEGRGEGALVRFVAVAGFARIRITGAAGFLPIQLLIAVGVALFPCAATAANRPNIVLIYADDLGYGDVGCYGATAVKTPNIDRLAREGVRFTDAHSAAATCTPSRYAMLTGEYAWRKPGTGILPGDAALIIEPGQATLAAMLRIAGYSTGVVGKWHLGLGTERPNWNGEIKPGPLEVGFDYCYIVPATGDRTPCVYVENHRVAGLDPADPIEVDYKKKVGSEPTGAERPDLLTMKLSHGHDSTIINGISRIGFMSGGKAARWNDETMADVLTGKATDFLKDHSKDDKPFFLYFATHDIHVPRVPHPRFRGATTMGPRGDAIAEFDWSVGQVLKTLDELNLSNNTIVILTSDNGPVLDDGYADDAVEKAGSHKPAGPWRGGKSTPYEGGTRVPFVVRWPVRVPAGKDSDALICQIDLLASLADLTGQKLPGEKQANRARLDSVDVLPALLAKSSQGREQLVEQGRAIALRDGKWKLIESAAGKPGARGNFAKAQLYNLANDPAEAKDLASEQPDRVRQLSTLLDGIRKSGRMPAND